MKLFDLRYFIVGALFTCCSVFAEPPTITIDAKDLKLKPIGLRIESTDSEADPDRQLVVTLQANGEIIDIRGRYSTKKTIEEWSIYYHDGSPVLAQLKKWNKLSIDGEELGDALVKVETFLAKDGKFADSGKNAEKRIMDMKGFAENRQAEQGGAEQPATAPASKPEGNSKPKPEAERRSQ